MSGQIDEYARGLAEDLSAWPREAVEDLAQLLINFDGIPSASRKRENQIGLLIEMLWRKQETTVSERDYIAERNKRRDVGEHWPSFKSLCSAYGDWTTAVDTALRVLEDNRKGAASHAHHYGSVPKNYTRWDILREIRRAREYFGREITHQDYDRLRTIELTRMRTFGKGLRDIPSRTAIEKCFGSWDRAYEMSLLDPTADLPEDGSAAD